jgi:tetratricopeptide (TPR) repeat protein
VTGYGTKQVAEMLGLSSGRVRGYVRAGFLSPARGPRGQLQFSFSDIVVLRTARGLLEGGIAPRQVRRALARLRRQLPDGRTLAGVRIAAEAGEVVVTDGRARWIADSGQSLFDFEVAELSRQLAPVARRAFREARLGKVAASAEDWFEWGCRLESGSPAEARDAYTRALELDPAHGAAHVNLGRLLHELGDVTGAASHYRGALESDPADAVAAFNLGVALEDLGRLPDALAAYERSLELEPDNPDAHYNAASVCEHLGRAAAALAHLKSYRQLTRPVNS